MQPPPRPSIHPGTRRRSRPVRRQHRRSDAQQCRQAAFGQLSRSRGGPLDGSGGRGRSRPGWPDRANLRHRVLPAPLAPATAKQVRATPSLAVHLQVRLVSRSRGGLLATGRVVHSPGCRFDGSVERQAVRRCDRSANRGCSTARVLSELIGGSWLSACGPGPNPRACREPTLWAGTRRHLGASAR